MPNSDLGNCPPSWQRRLHAIAVLQFGTVDALYRRLPLCQRAIRQQLACCRLSNEVKAALISELGEPGLRFVVGELNSLNLEVASHAAAQR